MVFLQPKKYIIQYFLIPVRVILFFSHAHFGDDVLPIHEGIYSFNRDACLSYRLRNRMAT